ncbi:hypothetical protein P171DRAFT_479571 [Karstenula rhodostoma CBS 690.94]|uniref:Uncharacterized protein n=1 Tax=Karstenula rhodostoma CBS 690.94 TaxID=1392251 RepID=A0A9P4UHC1_9PLEO|nr:hypothetical protein P171DRAFT_479571 [Karstenula rhodostoma CBS 690.94]
MAGIVQYHSAKLQDTPLLGLWEKSLPLDLSWGCLKGQVTTIPGITRWAWLCFRGEVERPPKLRPQRPMLELIDASCIKWERQPLRPHSDSAKAEYFILLTLLPASDDSSAYVPVGRGTASLSALGSRIKEELLNGQDQGLEITF